MPDSLPSRHLWLGYLVVAASVLVTYLLWIGSMWYGEGLYDNVWKYPAKVGSHGTLILMCWAIIFAARLRPVEWLFGGLDKVYKAHRRVGVVAFVLIFLHPIFLAAAFTDSIRAYLGYLWFSADWVRNTGIIAFAAFTVLVALSILVKIPYHRWKRTHDFFGVLLILVAAHGVLARGEIVQYNLLTAWHGFWVAVALIAYLYIRLLYRFVGPLYDYVTKEVKEIGDDITEVFLAPMGRPMHHKPGQFAYISFDASAVSEEPHPISISSPPESRYLRLSIKGLGDWTRNIPQLSSGEPARIWGPYGKFAETLLRRPRLPLVMAGGGIGITPFLSLIGSEVFSTRLAGSSLIYSVPDNDAAVYDAELRAAAERLPHLDYRRHNSDEEGFIDRAYLERLLNRPLHEHLFLVCGPPPMMSSFRAFLTEAGVLRRQILMEEFSVG